MQIMIGGGVHQTNLLYGEKRRTKQTKLVSAQGQREQKLTLLTLELVPQRVLEHLARM